MMKRLCSKLLALILCLMLLVPATLAEDMRLSATPAPAVIPTYSANVSAASILPTETPDGTYWMVSSAVTVGDTVYILTYYGQEAQLWRWRADMPAF